MAGTRGIAGIDEIVEPAGIIGKRSIIVFAPCLACYHVFWSGAILLGHETKTRMFLALQYTSVKRFARAALAVVAAASAIAAAGCESAPIRALRGARHYTAGTEALERNDDAKAVAELEQAAVLVPHASEIQNHLGLAYWSDGRPQSARVAFAKAIELDCDNDAARANLESLMQQQGDVVMQAKSEEAIRVDDNGE